MLTDKAFSGLEFVRAFINRSGYLFTNPHSRKYINLRTQTLTKSWLNHLINLYFNFFEFLFFRYFMLIFVLKALCFFFPNRISSFWSQNKCVYVYVLSKCFCETVPSLRVTEWSIKWAKGVDTGFKFKGVKLLLLKHLHKT